MTTEQRVELIIDKTLTGIHRAISKLLNHEWKIATCSVVPVGSMYGAMVVLERVRS